MKKTLTVWKFPIANAKEFTAELPADAKILSVQRWKDFPCFWVLVDPQAKKVQRRFTLVGTGHSLEVESSVSLDFLGTFQMHGGDSVTHLFELVGIGKILKLLPASSESAEKSTKAETGEVTPTEPKGTNAW
jgi:hypothetical protein